jgi:Sulfotransferase family
MKYQECLPNFLGIGGTRCGSTWLHYNLLAHSDLWLPPVKELHYFDRSPAYQSPSYLAGDRLRDRLFGQKPYNLDWRRRASRDLSRALSRHVTTLPWKLKYYLGRPSDAWYASLFKRGRGRLRGEITPAYSILSARDVAYVHSLIPDAKVIFFMRNPVYRVWSGYRKNRLTESQIKERLAEPQLDRRSDYLAILATWESVIPQEQMFVDFYDEIEADPVGLLTRVYEFLGVDASAERIPASLRERMNAAPSKPMPEEAKRALSQRHLPMLEELSNRFGGHATKWLEEARATVDGRGRAIEAA